MNYELLPPSDFTLIDSEFNNALISQLDLEQLLRTIFEHIKQVFRQATAATLAIHDPKTNELRIHLLHSDDPELFREGMPLPKENTPSGLAYVSRCCWWATSRTFAVMWRMESRCLATRRTAW